MMTSLFTHFSALQQLLYERSLIFADACTGGGFFGLPTWYKYLKSEGTGVNCSPKLNGLNDIWLIVLAVVEILLRIGIMVAITFVILGGFKFILSRGNPDKIQQARNTVQDALIGVIIAIAATAVVSFVAGRFN